MIVRTKSHPSYPSVALMIVTDGRDDYIERTWNSWNERLDFSFDHIAIVDDSANPRYQQWLDSKFASKVDFIHHHKSRYGFGRTVDDMWKRVPVGIDYVFHLEDDFLLNRSFNLSWWIKILQENPNVVQVCAYRQPWSQAEIEKGGFINLYAECYSNKIYSGFDVVEHKRNFSTNPSLYPSWLCYNIGWPEDPESEGKLSFKLRDLNQDFVYLLWGNSNDEPLVHHFGQRRGTGY